MGNGGMGKGGKGGMNKGGKGKPHLKNAWKRNTLLKKKNVTSLTMVKEMLGNGGKGEKGGKGGGVVHVVKVAARLEPCIATREYALAIAMHILSR